MTESLFEFESPCGDYQLVFEDNGKVAYAYLMSGKEIVGDVWLYNRCPTPEAPEWTDRSAAPFANCRGYMSEQGRVTRPISLEEVLVDWETDEAGGPVAFIYVFEDLYGVIGVGDKPGYARFATQDGPLGRVMEIEEE